MSSLPPDLPAIAAALEIPDCGCPDHLEQTCQCDGECDCPRMPGPPCPHMLAADHAFSASKWAALLSLAFPDDYQEPPSPKSPALALNRQTRVAVYEERAALGVGLFHPLDSWRPRPQSDCAPELHVAVEGKRLRNGRVAGPQRLRRSAWNT